VFENKKLQLREIAEQVGIYKNAVKYSKNYRKHKKISNYKIISRAFVRKESNKSTKRGNNNYNDNKPFMTVLDKSTFNARTKVLTTMMMIKINQL
jgi:hypothetical protein